MVQNPDFQIEVGSFPKYTHTASSPAEVMHAIRDLPSSRISTYRTRSPWSKVLATTYASDRSTLYLNLRKNPRPMPEMVNTVIHEGLHLAGFSHGDNSPAGKQDSVNYRVGAIAEKYVPECQKH